jgi:protein TonB
MFQDVVSSRARARGSWYSLPLSFLAHTVVIAVLVVVPLVATDVLPMPRTALEYINHDFTPVMATPPPEAPRRLAATPVAPGAPGVPLEAPDTIGIETAVIIDQGTIATQSIDGVVGGLGAIQNVIEAPPAVAPPSAPVRTGGDIKPPARTKYVAPEYPEIARRSRVEGIVIIDAIIGTDGRVVNARVLRSHPLLDAAALEAVRSWEYTPTLLNNVPTPVIMTVTIRFNLN